MNDAPSQKTVTSLSRKWLTKMWIFMLALIFLGLWGLWDATIVYPNKGARHARFMLKEYLARLDDSGLLLRDANVEDPAAELSSIELMGDVAADSIEAARRTWLVSLSRIHSLQALADENQAELQRRDANPASPAQDTTTMFADPSATLAQLDRELQNQSVPSPVNAFDIPFQYVLMVGTWGGAAIVIVIMLRSAARKFRYDHESKTLTLPDGRAITPEQIEVVDKRDWHKYFVYLKVDGAPDEMKLDLLRYDPLESWILEMEKLHPNYEPPEDDEGADGSEDESA